MAHIKRFDIVLSNSVLVWFLADIFPTPNFYSFLVHKYPIVKIQVLVFLNFTYISAPISLLTPPHYRKRFHDLQTIFWILLCVKYTDN